MTDKEKKQKQYERLDPKNAKEEPLTKWFLLLEANEDQEIAREMEGQAMSDPVLHKAVRE